MPIHKRVREVRAMFDIAKFTMSDMAICGASLRSLGARAETRDEVARNVVTYLYGSLGDEKTGQRACALVRMFQSCAFADLDPDRQRFARAMAGQETLRPQTRCLALLATAGDDPAWNVVADSRGHQAIPLLSDHAVRHAPMISALFRQLGIDVGAVLQPALLVDRKETTFNVFHVPNALGSENIPAQAEFVVPFGIRSVLGFGGVLPNGDIFAVILFARVEIPRPTAEMFKTMALNVKLALLPFAAPSCA